MPASAVSGRSRFRRAERYLGAVACVVPTAATTAESVHQVDTLLSSVLYALVVPVRKFMDSALHSVCRKPSCSGFASTVLYTLAAPSTPEEVREKLASAVRTVCGSRKNQRKACYRENERVVRALSRFNCVCSGAKATGMFTCVE